jgi:voltage-gated potassium channel
MNRIYLKSRHFLKLILRLITGVPFLTISLIGNFIVFNFALIVFYIEKDVNPKINIFIDALWWSFSTATTVGYGDITPITTLGKSVGIILMLIGVAIFGIYTSLFARAIIDDDSYMD